ncbi:MAG: hypothetical protein RLZZ112_1315 [Verrucomicrobiota bacterium]
MKKSSLLVAMLVAFAAFTQAGSKPNESAEPVSGRIAFLGKAGDKITVKPSGGGESVNFKVTSETKVSLNGEEKTLGQLKQDWKVKVTPKEGEPATAAMVEATKGAKTQDKQEEPKE